MPHRSLMDLAAQKTAARTQAFSNRARCDPAWGRELAGYVMAQCKPPAGAVVAGFWPLPGEINIYPLLESLAASNITLCLPVTPKRGAPLSFRRWLPGDQLEAGRFKTMHPATGDTVTPDFILTPLLAFDRFGHRLGYGAGYYDRTFATLPTAFRLGCAFKAQELPAVPHGPDDIKLHAIATEGGVYRFR